MKGKINLNKYPKLKCFSQHGLVFYKTSGEKNLLGECVICGGEKFYANHETRLWICDGCHNKGNFNRFLDEVAKMCLEHLKGSLKVKLAKDRGLKTETLERNGVGYNPHTNYYTIPIPSLSGESLVDIRLYRIGKPLRSSLGGTAGIAGIRNLLVDAENTPVWICEGQWDWLVAEEILYACKKKVIPIGIPGADVFKQEWTDLFQNRDVVVIYDNDDAGKGGENKVYHLIKDVVSDLKFIHWESKRPKGFDLRDFYEAKGHKPKETFTSLMKLSKSEPRMTVTEDKTKTERIVFNGPGLGWEDVVERYQEWLYLYDTDVIEILYGSVIANRMPGDPIWLFLVGPPGCGKTELLLSVSHAAAMTPVTNFTPHTLISGFSVRGSDPSLIPKLNNRILVIKDFTTILNMPYNHREDIFGVLRDAYDGECGKPFGQGVWRKYKSKFGIVAGVTPVIETMSEGQSALGERFLSYKFHLPPGIQQKIKMVERANKNTGKEVRMKKDLNDIGVKTLNHDYRILPEIPPDINAKIIGLAQWSAVLRGSVQRERFTDIISYKPSPEVGTRLAKQFTKVAMGIAMFKRQEVVSEREYFLVTKLAKDAVPSRVEEVVRKIYLNGKYQEYDSREMSQMTTLPSTTCSKILQDLAMLKVVKKIAMEGYRGQIKYRLRKDVLHLMDTLNLYKGAKDAKSKKKKD